MSILLHILSVIFQLHLYTPTATDIYLSDKKEQIKKDQLVYCDYSLGFDLIDSYCVGDATNVIKRRNIRRNITKKKKKN